MTKIKASIVEEDLKGAPNVYAIGYLDALERAGVEVVDDGAQHDS